VEDIAEVVGNARNQVFVSVGHQARRLRVVKKAHLLELPEERPMMGLRRAERRRESAGVA
jgi:hypothetical protein